MVSLAGVAGAGKTTVARLVSKWLRYRYVDVEAPECWPITRTLDRQRCFLEKFSQRLLGQPDRRFIADNSLLSVYAYTAAMLGPQHTLAKAALSEFYYEMEASPVVVIDQGCGELRRRILARLGSESERARNTVEKDMRLHCLAREYLLSKARDLGLMVMSGESRAIAKQIVVLENLDRL